MFSYWYDDILLHARTNQGHARRWCGWIWQPQGSRHARQWPGCISKHWYQHKASQRVCWHWNKNQSCVVFHCNWIWRGEQSLPCLHKCPCGTE
jgi:hypothetical protein